VGLWADLLCELCICIKCFSVSHELWKFSSVL